MFFDIARSLSFKKYLVEAADEEKDFAYDAKVFNDKPVDYYYISAGKLTRMYTLRHAYTDYIDHVDYVTNNVISEPYVADVYVRNLSTDWDKAVQKAKEFLGPHANKLNIKDSFTLDEIRRRNAEEMEEYRRHKEQEEQERLLRWTNDAIKTIQAGYWPFGKYKDEKLEAASKSYIKFMATKIEPDEGPRGNAMRALQAILKKKFKDIIEEPELEIKDDYFGEPGKRYDFVATVDRIFSFEGYYGWVYIIKMIKDSGEILVYKGNRHYELEEGDKVKFKATVKDHEEYKGEKQTKIQRINNIEFLNKNQEDLEADDSPLMVSFRNYLSYMKRISEETIKFIEEKMDIINDDNIDEIINEYIKMIKPIGEHLYDLYVKDNESYQVMDFHRMNDTIKYNPKNIKNTDRIFMHWSDEKYGKPPLSVEQLFKNLNSLYNNEYIIKRLKDKKGFKSALTKYKKLLKGLNHYFKILEDLK